MPDVSKLSPKARKEFLGCIEAKAGKWRKLHPGRDKIPKSIMDRFFRSCARKFGYD
jgi:hypothetical protein